MKNSVRKLWISLPLLILAISAIVMRCIACFTELDYSTGYFRNSLLISIADYTVAAMVVLLLISLAMKADNPSLRPSFRGPLGYIPSGVAAVSLVFVIIELISYIIDGTGGLLTRELFSHPSYAVAALTVLLAICAIGYFAFSSLVPTARNLPRAEFGMLAALFFAFYTAYLYFAIGMKVNLPAKLLDEMVMLSVAIFLIQDTRVSLGREKWKPYFVFGAIAILLTAYSAIPTVIVYIFRGITVSESLPRTLLIFAMLIFTVCRLISASRLGEEKPSGFATAIDAPAGNVREEEGDEEEDSPQISIEDIEEVEGEGEK